MSRQQQFENAVKDLDLFQEKYGVVLKQTLNIEFPGAQPSSINYLECEKLRIAREYLSKVELVSMHMRRLNEELLSTADIKEKQKEYLHNKFLNLRRRQATSKTAATI